MQTRRLFCLAVALVGGTGAFGARPWTCGHWVRSSGGEPILEVGIVVDHAYVVGRVSSDLNYECPPLEFDGYYPYVRIAALGGQMFATDPQGEGFGAEDPEHGRLRFWWADRSARSDAGPLVNVSSRVTLAREGRMILGFVIDRPGTRVLLRAVGPGLSGFGVEHCAGNPRLTLFRGSQRIVESDDAGLGVNNTDELRAARKFARELEDQGRGGLPGHEIDARLWRLRPNAEAFAPLRMAEAAVGAFALDGDTLDAAVVVELNRGAYTLVIDAETPGEVLGEVYVVGR